MPAMEYLGALQNCPSICVNFPCMVEPHAVVHSGADITCTNKIACKTSLVIAHTAIHVLTHMQVFLGTLMVQYWSQQATKDMEASCLTAGSEQLEWERQRHWTPAKKQKMVVTLKQQYIPRSRPTTTKYQK